MPQARVRRTVPAERDYLQIWLYVAERSGQPRTADRLLRAFDKKLDLLAEFPRLGQERPELGTDVRTLPVGNYLLIYRPVKDGIELLRVIHGARDLRDVFIPQPPREE
jgi:toxin ParE1/3/4